MVGKTGTWSHAQRRPSPIHRIARADSGMSGCSGVPPTGRFGAQRVRRVNGCPQRLHLRKPMGPIGIEELVDQSYVLRPIESHIPIPRPVLPRVVGRVRLVGDLPSDVAP